LGAALNTHLDPESAASFEAEWRRLDHLIRLPETAGSITLDGDTPGKSKKEKHYWDWCLVHRLCLNSLNDLDVYGEAATDILLLPPVIDESGRGAYVLNLFNEIKQGYVTARFMLYDGMTSKTPHFADHNVALVNTLSYAAHSLCLEKVRIAFRMAYSMFDKMAFLVNAYLELGIRPHRVNFRRLWFENEDQRNDVKPLFHRRENHPLRGLFGLSRDLCAADDDRDALDPEARDLAQIRNHMEHKHLSIHEESWIAAGRGEGGEASDRLSFAIDRDDFESRTMRMLKLARSAMVYLVHAVLVEEMTRTSSGPQTDVIIPMVFPPIDDRAKR
jgi:hypothetical protein